MANGQGALAAVTEEEEVFDPSAVTGTEEILEEVKPDPIAELRKMATMTKDDAMERLRESRNTLAARRSKQEQRAEQDRWLALAQSMLSPTKTGAFGENVGYAAGALRDVNASTFEQEQAIAEEEERLLHREYEIAGDYFDSLANLEGFQNNSRARVVGTSTAIDPRVQHLIRDNPDRAAGEILEAEADRVMVSTIMQPDGTTISRVETSDGIPFEEGGEPFLIVDPRKVPSQAAAQTRATVTATQATTTAVEMAKRGFDAIPRMERLQRAYGMLQGLKEDTSGLSELMRKAARFAGITEVIDDNTTLSQLHSMFGSQVLQDLRALTGSKTDFEYTKVETMNANLGSNTDANLAVIDEQMGVLSEMIDKGEYAAQNLGEGPGTGEKSFWLENYLRYRKRQAEFAAEFDAVSRQAPDHMLERFMDLMDKATGNPDEQGLLIKEFDEHYELPDEYKLELRKAGVAI